MFKTKFNAGDLVEVLPDTDKSYTPEMFQMVGGTYQINIVLPDKNETKYVLVSSEDCYPIYFKEKNLKLVTIDSLQEVSKKSNEDNSKF